jgi:uncharacterized protein YbdZ (MbtH family)
MPDEYPDWQDETVKVVRNHENYCSIWPAERETPQGWQEVGVSGSKEECLEYIKGHCDANCRLREKQTASEPSSP